MEAWKKKTAYIFAAVLMVVFTVGGIAHAAEQQKPDYDRRGSISVAMQDPETDNPVSGGKMVLYRVADVQTEKNAELQYALTADFSDSKENLSVLDAALAKRLAAYADQRKTAGKEQTADAAGRITFQDLSPGLFLLVQNEAVNGYYKINPFLVSVPFKEDGRYIYEVDASPKMELLKESVTPPTEPSDTPKSNSPGSSGSPVKTGDDTKLFFWGILAACSLLGAGILGKRRKNL